MSNIEKLNILIKQSNSLEELIEALSKEEFSAIYMRQANQSLKKEQGINPDETWHRFFIETNATPVNKWENISNYTVVLISNDLQKMKIITR